MTKKQVSLVKSEAARVTGDPECRSAQVLLASAVVGPSADKIARLLGLPRALVRTMGRRARENRIWSGRRITAGWFEKDGGMALVADSLCVDGLLARVSE